ncbi:Si-specific NAD(P)(+) transhydrogenase [Teredinibacter sp. KSP-S5-2]|nr:Si-specific NAD(P)(+) transhydrogenase [Teredinibacter sp. KSP-S5-2]WNO10144.1 Si-specific NAD(P)(+) transhydrogenase [Teredinibacter sp. KSP-S5-2]
MNERYYDMVVIGSGPAGQKAAIQARNLGNTVALIEKTRELGGSCVHRGTIPSKTLRENALRVKNMRMNAELANFKLREDLELATLINRLEIVLHAHDKYMSKQMTRCGVEFIHGRARFLSPTSLEVTKLRQEPEIINCQRIVIATGSHPRVPDNIPIDHEHLLDSDSILSMMYLPKSLVVLGGGVIASEYASIFQALGVKVTMIDKYPRPLGFLDDDLSSTFISAFENMGGTWLGNTNVIKAYWNGYDGVITECEGGLEIKSDKLLCAAGRIANVSDLNIEEAGLQLNSRGLITVDEHLQTQVPSIYAAGDVIGPPSLASASMEQGRRASCNALGKECGRIHQLIPTGIYSIPELSSVGLSETQAKEQYGENVIVGRSFFDEIARGQINDIQDGMLKIVCDPQGRKVLGVMIVAEGATELVHIGQMALLNDNDVDVFVESIFNFPTLAEAYRVAALDVLAQREKIQ